MSRNNFKISRDEYSQPETGGRVHWLDSFANSLAAKESAQPKSAVEIARSRSHQSIMDQINSIVGNGGSKTKHSTVESVVQEMQERTGLKSYLNRMSSPALSEDKLKTAQENINQEILTDVNPALKEKTLNFIKNKIRTHRGMVAIPAIQEEILSIFKRDGIRPQDINTEDVANYINKCIIDERKTNPIHEDNNVNLGKGVGLQDLDDDGANSDFFKGLMVNSE